jgi:hypothetical protein
MQELTCRSQLKQIRSDEMKWTRMFFCALAAVMALAGCANLSTTEQRTLTGAAIGGTAAGVISGEWGWAVGGAAAGAIGGYLYDQHKKSEEQAYKRGVKDGQKKK